MCALCGAWDVRIVLNPNFLPVGSLETRVLDQVCLLPPPPEHILLLKLESEGARVLFCVICLMSYRHWVWAPTSHNK